MPEEIKTGETPQPAPVTGQEPAASAPAETVETKVTESAEELARKLRNKTEEAERLHKKVEKFEADEAERKKASLSEIDRLRAELDEAKSQAAKLSTLQAQRDAAEKVGLPLAFADRIRGATPEELEADAKALLEGMPKVKKVAPSISSSTPADASPQEMTDEDRRKFLFGR